ncbi:MAG TPA: VOC family protein [Acidobacteriota bacterium]|jgi:catechol 2,3-dioxygenase-like lactoylglutathione lyase family enzyme|nr:VOC family protein [Acidobacteriota bacterium]
METSLYVADVGRAVAFYRDVLGLKLIGEFVGERGAAMTVGQSILLLFNAAETLKGGDLPAHGASGTGHVAFRVEAEDLDKWRSHLPLCGIPIEREYRFGENPPSIYFRDPDGNVLELAVASIWPPLVDKHSPQRRKERRDSAKGGA